MIFQRIIPFLAINKLRLSTYLSTPSGNPKLKFWLSLLIPKIFSYPLGKAKDVKKVIDFFTAAGKPNFSAIGTIPAESAKERNKIKNKYTKRAAVRPQIGGQLKPYELSIQKDYDFLITRHIGFNSSAPNRSAWRIAWLGGLLGLADCLAWRIYPTWQEQNPI